jgi:hypothetical protein
VSAAPRPLVELDAEAVASLARDGLVAMRDGDVSLPA